MIRAAAENAAEPLTTPTYDESGQACHPDVVDMGLGNTWNGHRYWMALTPYTGGNDDVENPSILVSDDGTTWAVPEGLTNPIVAFPGGSSFNADPDLLIAQDNKAYCYYMTSDAATYNKCMVVSSTDGVTWGAPAELFSAALIGIASPSVLWDGTQYVMWYIDASASLYKIYRRTCATPAGAWSEPTELIYTPVGSLDVWHMDVIKDGANYYAFVTFCDRAKTGDNSILYFARSTNGIDWAFDVGPLLDQGFMGAWDETRIHRSTGVRTATGFDLWYSARSYSPVVWRIGKTAVTLP